MTGPRILVVDDEPDVRDAFELALEVEGYEVRTAAHGREAWEMLDHGLAPAVILLDLMMPVMNGIEFLTALRADSRFRSIPVLIVTAFSRMLQDLRLRGLKAQGYLEKPISIEALVVAIQSNFGRSVINDGALQTHHP